MSHSQVRLTYTAIDNGVETTVSIHVDLFTVNDDVLTFWCFYPAWDGILNVEKWSVAGVVSFSVRS